MDFEGKENVARECFKAVDKLFERLESHMDCNIVMGEMQTLLIDGNIYKREDVMDKPKVKSSEWKEMRYGHRPEDDQTCLVAWKNSEGEYSQPVIAWWSEEVKAFFDYRTLHSFPLHVDIWCPIPEMPNET